MNNLKCSPIFFSGKMIIKSYENGDLSERRLETNRRQDYKIKKLAQDIITRSDDYMPHYISAKDADKMYDLLRSVTNIDLKNIPNPKALFFDDKRIIFGDTHTRLVGGEAIHIYF